ncbi:TonB-dependent hemoglobin/transferrin/lactoferrin family receptor [Azospira restricta]|uniref:TonB-dependent hemoglobin/transferrin/lactoferrin family receptor n=1 Tax=Azospira restricta TaxID=404405 RepID=A0A974SNK6_9RHOO|nr:TonB-dependent hemoglobin/transferrin/lactoferrin family receptor [Azospira restricta]QRJ63188.1 TonB-dependent hemoglobin/transferrin/lactoferrin family receptor [Azospira restricta]
MSAVRAHPRRCFTLQPLAATLAAALSAAAFPALADTALRDTVVTATRSAAAIDDLPVTVTTVTREEMDRRLPADEADLFRDEPDVAMARDLRRFGATRVNIRGIEDNRVVTMVDGVRLPDFYNGGGPTNFSMSATPSALPDFLKQVEIVRGPASSLYGSDAMGGVVGFVTLDPADIATGERKAAVRVRGGYFGASEQFSGSVVGALRGERAEFLLGYGEAHGHEADNQGRNDSTSRFREKPNPADSEDRGLLAKLVLKPAAGHKLTATVESREQKVDTDVRRLSGSLPKITRMLGDDSSERTRFSLEYEHKPTGAFYDRLLARAYHQRAETHNENYQRRSNTGATCSASTGAGNNCDIFQDFRFEQTSSGINLQFESLLGKDVTQLLTYGVDLMRSEVEELRDATRYNLTTGTVSKSIAGENYPLRDFANGRTDTIGLFVQDEIGGLVGGRLTLTPGIRYDRTTLKPQVDALSQGVLTAINRSVAEQSYSRFSPKLAAQWKVDEALSTYGQIAAGFRAPNYNEVNGAFRNTAQLYATIPNGELKPETSVGVELGLRAKGATARGQVAVFHNKYKDFIETVRLACPSDPACIAGFTTYQSRNLSKVRIYGAEARGSWDFMPGWRVDGALAYAHGDNQEDDQPLNSIEPMRLSLGLVRDAGSWGAEARLRAAKRKTRIDDSDGTASDPVYYRTPGYGVTDLAAWIKPSRDTRLTVGVNNLFDKKYWLWSDIRQADARNPAAVDFYSQPGRSFRVAFQADF